MRARVLTALALAPIVLGTLFIANPWPLYILAAIVAYIGGREISRMLGQDSHVAGALSAVLVLGIPFTRESIDPLWFVAMTAIGSLSAYLAAKHRGSSFLALALFWVVGPMLAIVHLHATTTTELFDWKTKVLMAILPLWGGDTAAIFAGKAFGKHLLAPKISPKKTVEGAVANFLACVLVAWGLGIWIGVSLPASLACGAVAGVFGQAGDLFESYIKRKADLKDSGNLLPGHGGLMDRIDSILFTAPAVAAILWYFGG